MVESVTGPGSTTSLGGNVTGGQAMGQDAFLKLLVAQLKYQDPLKPQDGSAFVAELAQFSNLEQTMGINDRLDMLALQNRGLANTEVVALVGKQATVRGNMVTSDGTGIGTPMAFNLASAADKVSVTIRDQAGQVVRTIDVGAKNGGNVQLMWDGRNDAGIVQPAGTYSVNVTAKDAGDNPVGVTQETKGIVTAVSFDKGYPVLHLENGISVPVSDLLRVDTANK
ncbi:MAG TPA: FlgD immunoglobulin-like domain containing protein [Polyangiaceae bacterium]|nr:FlgD immunoglobulin-like domain containing protein [Polyangiaceae bacterium]HMR78668.1 FlgD immunoglobulin-like domain containing protein [Polyangiaceae bacterium]